MISGDNIIIWGAFTHERLMDLFLRFYQTMQRKDGFIRALSFCNLEGKCSFLRVAKHHAKCEWSLIIFIPPLLAFIVVVALPQIKRKENPLPSQRAHHSDFAESAVISVAAASERARRGLLYVHHRCTPQCSDAAAVVFLPGEIWKAK